MILGMGHHGPHVKQNILQKHCRQNLQPLELLCYRHVTEVEQRLEHFQYVKWLQWKLVCKATCLISTLEQFFKNSKKSYLADRGLDHHFGKLSWYTGGFSPKTSFTCGPFFKDRS